MLCIRNLFFISISFISYLQASSKINLNEENICTSKVCYERFKDNVGDIVTIVHQGAYKVYDIPEKQKDTDITDVVVLRNLSPCKAIVATDSNKLIAFHMDWENSLESLHDILKANLNFSIKANLHARIHAVNFDNLWENNYAPLCDGISQKDDISKIKNLLSADIGMLSQNVIAHLHDINTNDGVLYPDDTAALSVAIRLDTVFETLESHKQIKFFSINPNFNNALPLNLSKALVNCKDIYNRIKHFSSKPLQNFQFQTNEKVPFALIPKLIPFIEQEFGFKIEMEVDTLMFYIYDMLICKESISCARKFLENAEMKEGYGQLDFYRIN